MSVGFYPKSNNTMDQALKVQELCIAGSDSTMFQISGGNLFVMVREPVGKIYLASCKVDSSNTVTQFAQSSLAIVDSSSLTAGGDKGAIELIGLSALAANDVVIVRYSVLEHL
jgi:hypothetical protein